MVPRARKTNEAIKSYSHTLVEPATQAAALAAAFEARRMAKRASSQSGAAGKGGLLVVWSTLFKAQVARVHACGMRLQLVGAINASGAE